MRNPWRQVNRVHDAAKVAVRRRRLMLLALGSGAVAIAALSASSADAATFAATASVSNPPQYLGDTTGTVFTFDIHNTGTSASIAAVEIDRPSSQWSITACPGAPAGWSTDIRAWRCTYQSSGPGQDIAPGASSSAFQVQATTRPGTSDRTGTWQVTVTRSGATAQRVLPSAGLSSTAYSIEILDAGIAAGPARAGSPCPALVHNAAPGSTQDIVVCGRNHTTAALTPIAARSSLSGTWLATPGTFSSGSVDPTADSRVLGTWSGAQLTATPAGGQTLIAVVGARFNRSSPSTTLTGYSTNRPPVAVDDAYSTDEDTPLSVSAPGVLSNDSDPDSDPITAVLATGPTHGSLSLNADGSFTYTPDADFNGTDSFTYRANDGHSNGNAATVTITVNAINDAPVLHVPAAQTINEDTPLTFSGGTAISVTDVDAGSGDVSLAISASHGTIALAGTSGLTITSGADGSSAVTVQGTLTAVNAALAGATYTPVTDFNGADSLSLTVDDLGNSGAGGALTDSAAVSITVNAVNDAPSFDLPASPDQTVLEDAGAQTVSGFASNISAGAPDESGQTLSFLVTNDNNALFSAQPSIDPTSGDLTFTPAPNANGSALVSVTLSDNGGTANGGHDTSSTQTFTINVTAVNDAPSFTLPASPDQSVINDQPAQTVAGFATAISAGPADESAQTLVFNVTADNPALFATQPAIDATSGDLTYAPSPSGDGTTTVHVTLSDNGGTANGGVDTSPEQTFQITVTPPNQPPTADDQSISTNEDTAKTVTLTGGDADGDPLTFSIVSGPAHGSLGTIGTVTCIGNPSVCSADVLYTPSANYSGSDSFTFKTNDGHADSTSNGTVSITVNAVNDAPVLANTEAGALSYTENDPATVITTTTTVADVDSANFDTGTLTVDYSANGTAGDRLAIRDEGTGAGQIGVSGSNVTYAGTTIGTFSGGSGTTPLVVTLNANADATATQALVRNITYSNVSDNPSTATRTVRFVLTDGDGGTSAPATRDIAVTAVNDPPALAGIEATPVDYIESVDSPPSQSPVTSALTVTDPDTNIAGATAQITTACQPSEDVLVFTNQLGITGTYNSASCLLTLTGSASPADYQTALRSINYEDTSDTPDTTTRTVTFQVDDGQAQNHASNTQSRNITVTASNDSPIGVADTFNGSNSALAGVTLAVSTSPSEPHVSITGNLLANDTDPDTAHANLTTTGPTTSTNAGVVSVNTDGTFTYTPAPGFIGSDTFSYTVHDNDAGSPKTGTGTVTINVVGPHVWFVNPGGAAGNGTSPSPLNSLAPLSTGGASDSLDTAGDVIFVYQGTGNATSSGFVLETNQQLIGQPQGLSVTDSLTRTFSLVSAGGSNPTITNSAGAGLTLASGNTIQRINVSGASGAGVTGSAVDTLTYGSNTTISGNTGGGVVLSGGGSGAVDVAATISTNAGHSVSVAGRTGGTTSFSGAVTDNGTGISLASNSGATINLTGGVTASTGASNAFTATGGGTVSVTGSTNTLTTTTGKALDVESTTIGASGLTFRSVTSNGAADGILLSSTGTSGGLTVTGTGTAGSGGTIQNSTDSGVLGSNTRAPNLSWMTIQHNGNALNEGGVRLTEISGSGQLTSSTVTGGFEDNVFLENTSGTLTGFTIQGPSCFIGNNDTTNGNTGVTVLSAGTATMTTTVSNCSFSGNRTDTIHTDAGDTANLTANITNNVITAGTGGNNQGNIGIDVTTALSGAVTFHVDNNKIGTDGVTNAPLLNTGINIFDATLATSTPATISGTVKNNLVYNAGAGQSGFGIRLFNQGYGTMAANVSGNTVSNVGLDYGLFAEVSSNSGTANAIGTSTVGVTNNTVSVLPGALDAIRVQARGHSVMNARISGNSSSAAGTGFFGLEIRQAAQTVSSVVYQATFNLEGLTSGLQTDHATIVSYLNSQNPGIVGGCDEIHSTGITGVPSVTGIPA